jgi:hypothetical protein
MGIYIKMLKKLHSSVFFVFFFFLRHCGFTDCESLIDSISFLEDLSGMLSTESKFLKIFLLKYIKRIINIYF